MFRLTAVLMIALYAVMIIWGEPADGPGVQVTRDNAFEPTLLASAAASPTEASAVSPAEAVRIALRAGEKPPAPDAADTSSASTPPEAAPTASAPEPEIWYVTGTRVNLRAGATISSAVVAQADLGDAAEILSDTDGNWIRIRTVGDGTEAYIYGSFLSPENPA